MKLNFTLLFSFIILLQVLFPAKSEAQDPRFSQFYAAPLQLNPAMTGVFEGRWRANINYRDQWSSVLGNRPFRTIAGSFDMKYHIVGDDFVGFGFNILRDEAGDSNFSINRAYLNFSYQKKVAGGKYRNDAQYLIAGAQFGAGQNSFDWSRLWFSSQYDPGTGAPDTGISNQEPGYTGDIQQTDIYLDFNAGLMYYALFGDNTSIYAGGALNHLNAPKVSFFSSNDEVLNMRWLGHAGGEVPLNNELSLLPAVVVMGQGPSFETTFGGNFRYTNHDWYEVAIRAGLWLRNTKTVSGSHFESFIVTAILEVERWNLGISYDITSSSLKTANNSRGAFELSLIYIHPAQSRYKVNCPKF
jgi:type IX secretion system PorP/SprF family membrane protein